MNDNILLSICIPTYNGSKYIRENLDKIIAQIEQYHLDNIEVVVSDNCSTDSIPQIMQGYVAKYPHIIRYNRNEKNLGYDGNVMKLCSLARGKFIHLFGDDDFYAPNGLYRLYTTLRQYSDLSVLVLSNYYYRNDYYGEIVSRKGMQEHFFFFFKIYPRDSDCFIIEIEDRAWPNTNLVFRREYFLQIPNLQQFYKKDWVHIYILLYLAKKWPTCYLFADKYPIVIDRVGVQTWLNHTDGPRIYYNNLWTYSFANQLGYDKSVFNWYRKKLLYEYIKNIQYRRSYSFRINFRYLSKYFPYWWDCRQFYFSFIPKFLNIWQEIFSINYDEDRPKKIKRKVLRFLFFEYTLAIKRDVERKIYFLHQLKPDELQILSNEKGNIKQFVDGSVLQEMYEWVTEHRDLFPEQSIKFMNYVDRMRHKKRIPYSWYLEKC